jgi:iron-sulfur cluster assembly accessory protein
MLEVTEKAAGKIKEYLVNEEKATGFGLRIRVSPGGCSGFQYDLELDEILESDVTFGPEKGLVCIDEISLPYLKGAKLDYIESINGSGFDISNPNAQSSCGCGSSFGV